MIFIRRKYEQIFQVKKWLKRKEIFFYYTKCVSIRKNTSAENFKYLYFKTLFMRKLSFNFQNQTNAHD